LQALPVLPDARFAAISQAGQYPRIELSLRGRRFKEGDKDVSTETLKPE
jgi:hypothetical protein